MEKDKVTRLKDALNLLRFHKIVKTQNDFAALIGCNRATLSLALNGDERYLTDSLISRAEAAAKNAVAPPQEQAPDIIIPAATAKMYADMAESIRILSELVAAQQKGDAAALAGKKLG